MFEKNCKIAEREFQKLDEIAAYGERVDPAWYWLYLVLGVCYAGLSVAVMISIFAYKVLNLNYFLNRLLDNIEAGPASFFASILLVFIGLYLMAATQKGVSKLGMRFFFIEFYPIKPKETFVNAFFVNCLIMNFWCLAITHFMVDLFRGYLSGTQIFLIFEMQIKHLVIFRWFWEKHIFIVLMILWWFISLIYFILRPIEKINLRIEDKRADLGSRQ